MNIPPKWFTIVSVIALLWNLLGCMAFVGDLSLSPADVAKLPSAQQALYNARPAWAVAGTALAVFGGALGCVGLLLRKQWAVPVFIASLIGILAQDFGLFFLANGAAMAGSVAVALQGVVFVIAVGLILLGLKAKERGWLR